MNMKPAKRRLPKPARDDLAERIAQLRAVAENPLVRPSVRVEARRVLKTLLPPAPRRVAVEPDGRGYPPEPPDW